MVSIHESSTKELKETKMKNYLQNINSKYILKQIMENLQYRRSLEIIKYNKGIRNRLNKTVEYYKDCMEYYSSIKINIIPKKEKIEHNERFINISKEEDKKYYHIFFNDCKEEIKRKYLNENDKVDKITIIIDYQMKSLYGLFHSCECIESITFLKFLRTTINDMSYMFYGCSSLKEINFTNFNTNNVKSMRSMFNVCSSLKELNHSNFNTHYVTDMGFMFKDCSSLKELNISNFNMDDVDDLSYMFCGCTSLKKLECPSSVNPYRNMDMHAMFGQCPFELKEAMKYKYPYIKDEAFVKIYHS